MRRLLQQLERKTATAKTKNRKTLKKTRSIIYLLEKLDSKLCYFKDNSFHADYSLFRQKSKKI